MTRNRLVPTTRRSCPSRPVVPAKARTTSAQPKISDREGNASRLRFIESIAYRGRTEAPILLKADICTLVVKTGGLGMCSVAVAPVAVDRGSIKRASMIMTTRIIALPSRSNHHDITKRICSLMNEAIDLEGDAQRMKSEMCGQACNWMAAAGAVPI